MILHGSQARQQGRCSTATGVGSKTVVATSTGPHPLGERREVWQVSAAGITAGRKCSQVAMAEAMLMPVSTPETHS